MADDWLEEEIKTEVSYGGDIEPQYQSAQDIQIEEGLQNVLGGQHALHGLLAHSFSKIGGVPNFVKWCANHETHYYKLLFTATPGMQPTAGFQGDVNLHIHHSLAPSPLDE